MHKLLSVLLFFIFSTPLMAANTHRGGAELLNSKAYSVYSKMSYFKTLGYFDNEGLAEQMVEEDEYNLIDLDFAVSYGVSKDLELTALGRFRKVSSIFNDEISNNSGLESLAFEGKYALARVGNVLYAVGVHYRHTLYTNKNYVDTTNMGEDKIILGDSGSEYGLDLFITYDKSSWKFDGKIGYNSPANNLSSEINYKIEGIYRLDKLALIAGVDGIYSLKKDEFTLDPDNKIVQKSGGTKLFNSINHQYIAPYAGVNYTFDKFIMGVRGQTFMSGISTDKGDKASLIITWNTDGETPEALKIKSFKEYHIDGAVLKVSKKNNFIRIDQGLSTDVEKGMKFDIYQTDYFGGNVLVASGVVYQIGSDWSVIKLTKRYKKIAIKPGFAARGY